MKNCFGFRFVWISKKTGKWKAKLESAYSFMLKYSKKTVCSTALSIVHSLYLNFYGPWSQFRTFDSGLKLSWKIPKQVFIRLLGLFIFKNLSRVLGWILSTWNLIFPIIQRHHFKVSYKLFSFQFRAGRVM